jgi:hypothetical protein
MREIGIYILGLLIGTLSCFVGVSSKKLVVWWRRRAHDNMDEMAEQHSGETYDDLRKRLDFAITALSVVERRRDQLLIEVQRLKGNSETFEQHDWLYFDRAPAAECQRCKVVSWANPLPTGPCTETVTIATLRTMVTAITEAQDLLERAKPAEHLEATTSVDWYSAREAWIKRNTLTKNKRVDLTSGAE